MTFTFDTLSQAQDSTRVGGILHSLSGIFPLYKPAIAQLEKVCAQRGTQYYAFSYDWRRDLNESADDLIAFLTHIAATHNSKLQVIGHSMGGLITLAALNARPDLFDSVVFAGTPFGTGTAFLEDSTEPRACQYTVIDDVFTWPSGYNFILPPEADVIDRAAPWIGNFVDRSGTPMNINLYNPHHWVAHRLSIFDKQNAKASPQQLRHLETCISRARAFRRKILFEPSVKYPPIAVLFSSCYPTKIYAFACYTIPVHLQCKIAHQQQSDQLRTSIAANKNRLNASSESIVTPDSEPTDIPIITTDIPTDTPDKEKEDSPQPEHVILPNDIFVDEGAPTDKPLLSSPTSSPPPSSPALSTESTTSTPQLPTHKATAVNTITTTTPPATPPLMPEPPEIALPDIPQPPPASRWSRCSWAWIPMPNSGDDRVASPGVIPPPGIPYTLYHTNNRHSQLLDDTSVPHILQLLIQKSHP
ncbi:hypothetical protein Pelo_14707 [Pelomyxa schiedti]|nr:hypothetical protein Pelo_14707 [Pelomyxa schiedti]